MYLEKHIKQKPSDFVVEEVIPFSPKKDGQFQLFLLKKSSLSTLQVVRFLSKLLKIKPSDIGFAGLKDRFAVTSQYITVPSDADIPDKLCFINKGGKWLKAESVDFGREQGFCIERVGFTDQKLQLGDNSGNRFVIKMRKMYKEQRKIFYHNLEIVKKYGCANYFGEQRFGSVKGRNDFIFLYLLKGNMEYALKTYFSIKGSLKQWGNWELFYRDLRGRLEDYEKDLILGLKRGLSFEKAIRILPKNVRLMFNFAFQSFLWNEYLRRYIESKYPFKRVNFIHSWKLNFYLEVYDIEYLKNLEIPYTGRDYPVNDSLLKDIIGQIIDKFGIEEEDFGREVAGINVLTDGLRKAVFFPEDFKIAGKTKDSITVSFFLPAGSYATILLRNLLS